MVRGEDHDRVIRLSASMQGGHDVTYGVINHGDHATGKRHRLLELFLACHESFLPPGDPLSRCPALMQPAHWRNWVFMRFKRQSGMKVGGIIHIPISAWRRERMMGIGKGYKGEERFVGLPDLIQKLDSAVFDETCGIKIFRHSRPNGLRASVIMGKLVFRVPQKLSVGRLRPQPLGIVAIAVVTMPSDHVDRVIPIIGKLELIELLRLIPLGRFVVIILRCVLPSLFDKAKGCRVNPLLRRKSCHRLHMALADGGGSISACTQNLRKGAGPV